MGEPPDTSDLRQRYAKALITRIMRSTMPEPLGFGYGMARIVGATEYELADAVLAVRDDALAELEETRLAARLAFGLYRAAHDEAIQAEAAVARVRALAEQWKHASDHKDGPLRQLLGALDGPADAENTAAATIEDPQSRVQAARRVATAWRDAALHHGDTSDTYQHAIWRTVAHVCAGILSTLAGVEPTEYMPWHGQADAAEMPLAADGAEICGDECPRLFGGKTIVCTLPKGHAAHRSARDGTAWERLCDELVQRAEQAEAAIARVRHLHAPSQPPDGHVWVSGGRQAHCKGCDTGDPFDASPWPCDTVRVLDSSDTQQAGGSDA